MVSCKRHTQLHLATADEEAAKRSRAQIDPVHGGSALREGSFLPRTRVGRGIRTRGPSSVSLPGTHAVSMPSTRSRSWPVWPTPPARAWSLRVLQERPKPDAATFLGSGKVDSRRAPAPRLTSMWSFSTTSCRRRSCASLQKRLDRKILDRTQLILDIFARRARTREGKRRWSSRSSNTCCRAWSALA